MLRISKYVSRLAHWYLVLLSEIKTIVYLLSPVLQLLKWILFYGFFSKKHKQ